MSWLNLEALFLFLPLIGLCVEGWLNKNKKTPFVQYSSLKIFKEGNQGLRARFSFLPESLKVFSLVLAIVALARPQVADTEVKRSVEGIDIIIALDISDSMLIEDMRPINRLEASKQVITDFIEKRISDRIGLVVFSGEAYTRVPLTLDYPLLLKSLAEVKTTRTIKMGTAIGVALANAVGRLKDSNAKSQVVIFLTDGESNTGTIPPETALDIAKGYGVKIYSIGMGHDGQAQLPIFSKGADGRQRKSYRPMHSQVNEKLLEKMAKETGGRYYRATTSDALNSVFKEIDQLEKTKIEVNDFVKYEEVFPKILSLAVFVYLLSLVLGQTVFRRAP